MSVGPQGLIGSVGQGQVQAGLLSSEIRTTGVPTPFGKAEGNIAAGAMRESAVDPAESENQGMHRTFVRENREIPSLPARAITGRAAQGRLRP